MNTTNHIRLWIKLVGVLALIALPGRVRVRATAMACTVTDLGMSHLSGNNAYHAVVWNGTTPPNLGTLGGSYSQG